jgi:hypothetical protein
MDERVASHLDLKCAPPEGPLYGRLSIAHLLLITAGSAVAIWLMQPPNGKAGTLEVVISAIFAPVYGTALAVVVLAFARGAIRLWGAIAEEPGHWLLLIIGSGFAGPALLIRSGSVIRQWPAPSPQPAWEIFLAFVGICVAIALLLEASVSLLVVIAEYHDSRRWHAVFCLLGLTIFSPCCGTVVLDSGALSLVLTVALLLVFTTYAAAVDIRERQYRDLWHWLGVGALFAAVCHAALFLFVIAHRR